MSDLTCHWPIAGDSDHRLHHLQPYQALCLISPVVVTICRWFWSSPLSASALPSTVSDFTCCCDYLQVILIFTCVSDLTCHCDWWQVILIFTCANFERHSVWSHLLLWLITGYSDLHLCVWSHLSLWLVAGDSDLHLCHLQPHQARCLISPIVVSDSRSFWSSPVSPLALPSTVSDLTRCCVWFQVILIFTCITFSPTKHGVWSHPLLCLIPGHSHLHLHQL